MALACWTSRVEQADLRVLLLAQAMAQAMPEGQRPQGANRVDEQRVRAVEGVYEPAIRQTRPAPGLHGAADLQRQLVEVPLPVAGLEPSLARQTPEVAVGADVVEAVVVHADVRKVRRHPLERPGAPELQEAGIAGGVELQDRRAELEALRPLGPAAGHVLALDGEDGRAVLGQPATFEGVNL